MDGVRTTHQTMAINRREMVNVPFSANNFKKPG
jgi:hypothetical protein